MRLNLVFVICFVTLSFSEITAQNEEVPDVTFADSLDGQHILLVFSGSDWCKPCIRLEKEVLSQPRFMRAMGPPFSIVKADFPRRKKMNKALVNWNESLAEKYNPSGVFPYMVLISPDRQHVKVIEYSEYDVDLTIRRIKDVSRSYTHEIHRREALLMGTQFTFTLVDSAGSLRTESLLNQCIDEVRWLEGFISEWNDSTEVSKINRKAGREAVQVIPEVYDLVQRSLILSRLTQGAFDISVLPLLDIWEFDGQETPAPHPEVISERLRVIGYEDIVLMDSSRIFLKKEGMRIGFGGIGKGYAADRIKSLMTEHGISDGVINASGDLTAWGKPPHEAFWKIAVADPRDPSRILCWLPVNDGAVATSGDYEKYLLMQGKRYGHILNPKTGYPVTGITSVTVISGSAELSDALATAIFVMGVETGLDLIEQLPNAECLIIDEDMRLIFSSHLNYIEN